MIIYKATNSVNGKYYIGQTTYSLAHRKSMHKKRAYSTYEQGRNGYFYNAIRKYGFDSFNWEVVAEAKSQEELDQLEQQFINDTPEGMSYNVIPGGRFNPMDDESLRLRQCERTSRAAEQISETMKAYYSTTDDSGRRQNIAKALKGNKNGIKYVLTLYDNIDNVELEFDSFVTAAKHIGISAPAVRQHWKRVQAGGGDYMKSRYRVLDVSEANNHKIVALDGQGTEYEFNSVDEAIVSLGLDLDNQTKSAIHRALREHATSRGYKWLEDKR